MHSVGQQGGQEDIPSNVTNAANVPKEDTADTKVNVDDAVVAKAPTGEEVDFKKISVEEALKVLKVRMTICCCLLCTGSVLAI